MKKINNLLNRGVFRKCFEIRNQQNLSGLRNFLSKFSRKYCFFYEY